MICHRWSMAASWWYQVSASWLCTLPILGKCTGTRQMWVVLYLSNLILIWYVAWPNFRYKCDGRGVHACELDGAFGGDPSSEVLKRGGLHWSSLRWFLSVVVRTKQLSSCTVRYLNEGLRREVVTHFQWLWHWHSMWSVQTHEGIICVHSLLLVDIADQTLLQIKYCTANCWKVYRYTKIWIQSAACWHNHATRH